MVINLQEANLFLFLTKAHEYSVKPVKVLRQIVQKYEELNPLASFSGNSKDVWKVQEPINHIAAHNNLNDVVKLHDRFYNVAWYWWDIKSTHKAR